MDKINLELITGQPLPKELGIKPRFIHDSTATYSICLGPGVIMLVAMANWTNKEVRCLGRPFRLSLAHIDDIPFITATFDKMTLEFSYNASLTSPDVTFQLLEEDEGFAFHFVLVDTFTTILGMRLVSLDTETSNIFIKDLLKNQSCQVPEDVFIKRYKELQNQFTIQEIEKMAYKKKYFR